MAYIIQSCNRLGAVIYLNYGILAIRAFQVTSRAANFKIFFWWSARKIDTYSTCSSVRHRKRKVVTERAMVKDRIYRERQL